MGFFDTPWHLSWSWRISSTGYKQAKMFLNRLEVTDHGIFGHLTLDNGFNCVTLERHDIAIPQGTYKVTLYDSPIHGVVPLLQGVPGRTDIEIHEGNWEFNSKGCILVGASRDRLDSTMIDNSKDTLKVLVSKLQGCDDISIQIV